MKFDTEDLSLVLQLNYIYRLQKTISFVNKYKLQKTIPFVSQYNLKKTISFFLNNKIFSANRINWKVQIIEERTTWSLSGFFETKVLQWIFQEVNLSWCFFGWNLMYNCTVLVYSDQVSLKFIALCQLFLVFQPSNNHAIQLFD